MKTKSAVASIIVSSMLWGIIGLFTRNLNELGYTSVQNTAMRCLVTALGLFLYLFITNREGLKIKLKDSWMFLGSGIGSIVVFNIAYFVTIERTTLSLASILLYTAPFFVVIMSAVFFGEKITAKKMISLVVAFGGCVLVCLTKAQESVDAFGIVTGIVSGLGYALYSIFNRIALKKYSVMTCIFYTFLIAAVCTLPMGNVPKMIEMATGGEAVLWIMGLGVVSTLIPYILYTWGLKYVEASKASIMAFLEPVVASIVGVILFSESLGIGNILGMVMIFVALVILNKI